jgi:peptidase E
MKKIYLLGGEELDARNSKEINQRIFADAGVSPKVLIFPWTSFKTTIKSNKYRKKMRDYFKEIGAREIDFVELSDSFHDVKRNIGATDIIYLPGGEPKYLVERMSKRKLIPLLNNCEGIVIGNSAGALSLCKKYAVIIGQRGRPRTKLESGLGLLNFGISVHYKSSRAKHLVESPENELKKLSKKSDMKIFAIPEQCALIYDFMNLEFIGDIQLFYKGKQSAPSR